MTEARVPSFRPIPPVVVLLTTVYNFGQGGQVDVLQENMRGDGHEISGTAARQQGGSKVAARACSRVAAGVAAG